MNTRRQTLPLWAFSKTEPANPQDWRSHHRRLAVGGNVAYHWKHNALNSRIFALTGGQTQHLRCYWGSCNHYTIGPFAKGIVCGWVFGSLHWQKFSSSPLKKKFFFLAVFGLGNSVHLLGKVIRHYYAKPSPGVVGWGDDTWDYGKSNLYH